MRANSGFQVGTKVYPANSFVVKTAQAGRPFILDMFQPQDHPNDFRYPGGPPIPPYDIAGWTLAYQMGVYFYLCQDSFHAPFSKIAHVTLLPIPVAAFSVDASPSGYLISHQNNNSFILVNRLLKNHADVYWLKSAQIVATGYDGKNIGTGAIWVPASTSALPILQQGAKELGVPVQGLATAPTGDALKLKPVRIGLYDQYGGIMPSGWLRWLLEQFEFPFEVSRPKCWWPWWRGRWRSRRWSRRGKYSADP
jgi:hypothetical protein